jgi:hypothetical protein
MANGSGSTFAGDVTDNTSHHAFAIRDRVIWLLHIAAAQKRSLKRCFKHPPLDQAS